MIDLAPASTLNDARATCSPDDQVSEMPDHEEIEHMGRATG